MKKTFILSLLAVLLVTASVVAQMPPPQGRGNQGGNGGPNGPGGQGGPQAGPAVEIVLKEVLGFSTEQLTALKGLLDTRKQATETLQAKLADAEKALAEALKATTPDPTQLGNLLLAVQALRTQLDQVNETFRTGFTALLTTDQQQKVTDILNLQKSLQAGQALHQLGL